MKRIIFLLILSFLCEEDLAQAITLETVMVVKSISGGHYREILLVDSQDGRWEVKNPTIGNINIGDALMVELDIKGREVVGCVIMEKLNEYSDEETNMEVLMRVDRNKKGRRALFDSDKNEWQLQLPRWATVGSVVIVDLVIRNGKVTNWHPRENLGYVASPTLSQ
jgi:hypothetical protein